MPPAPDSFRHYADKCRRLPDWARRRRGSSGYHPRQEIGLHGGDDADQGGECQAVFHREAEEIGFSADEPCRGAGDRDRLRRDHLPCHAAGRVDGDEQDIADADLMRGGGLQRGEKRVGGRIRPGEEHAEPAEEGREEGEARPV